MAPNQTFKIAIIGKFSNLHDEEYIARSFEMLGHEVIRINQLWGASLIHRKIVLSKPEILIFTKWQADELGKDAIRRSKEWGMKTVCWLFDLYWGYEREFRIKTASYFKADYVMTTDGGHEKEWQQAGVNHFLVRQGIYDKECLLLPIENPQGIVFVGSENAFNSPRNNIIKKIKEQYTDFHWHGRNDTNEVRGMTLNKLYSRTKIVIGDSVYSPYYWSNRVVETLGRGGFLIHREVEGLKEEYPDLVTYDGTFIDLQKKIDYYLTHEDERQEIIKKNFELVRSKYTMDKKCQILIANLTKKNS